MAPYLDVATAKLHLEAAARVGEPELLLAMAYVESRYVPSTVSEVRRERFCGPLQVAAEHDPLACLAMRDLVTGYAAGAWKLGQWLHAAHGDLHDALNGYGCGYYGIEHGCRNYAERVLAIRARLLRRSS